MLFMAFKFIIKKLIYLTLIKTLENYSLIKLAIQRGIGKSR